MRTDIELLEDALCLIDSGIKGGMAYDITREIRARLAEPEDEPVAWLAMGDHVNDDRLYWDKHDAFGDGYSFVEPLYRHPPRPTGLDQLLERIRFLEQQIAKRNK